MKTVSISLLVFSSLLVSAQNYENICPPGKLFFKDSGNNLKAFRMDSAVLSGSTDTLFYSYRTIIDTGGPCRDTINGSILGRKILKKANGLFCFFNRHQDSIFLNTQASLNQSWKFFSLPSGDYIQATVTSIISDSIAGMTDLMKVITLQAKDQTGNNISHPLNGKSIRLSKSHGLALMLDVYTVPDDTVMYSLAGSSSLNWGITGSSWKDIYDYEIGDIFHYKITSNWEWFYQSTIINRIIGKTDYGGEDSVSYQVEYCQRWDGIYPPYYDAKSDTVTVKYNFLQLDLEEPFHLPEEFTRLGYPPSYSAKLGFPGLRLINEIFYGMTEYHPWDSCYSDASEDGFKEDNFTVGLGYTKYYYKLWFWNGIVTRDESLVYYQKVSETWGTPVAADCDVLTGLERSREQVQTGIEVIPNPAETEAIVRVPDKSVSGEYGYTLFNYLGSKVAEGKFFSNPFSVSLSGISPGVYLLMVTGPGGVQEGTVRIVRK